jgi:hypothetical protein
MCLTYCAGIPKQLVVIAVARELAGFLWAEMIAEHARP